MYTSVKRVGAGEGIRDLELTAYPKIPITSYGFVYGGGAEAEVICGRDVLKSTAESDLNSYRNGNLIEWSCAHHFAQERRRGIYNGDHG
jgi:hypothetical protein